MITADVAGGRQARLLLNPQDSNGNPVVLDPNSLTVSLNEDGGGTFEYNAATNGLVFRGPADRSLSPETEYLVQADPLPGPGPDPSAFIPIVVRLRFTPMGASTLGETLGDEAEGTPA